MASYICRNLFWELKMRVQDALFGLVFFPGGGGWGVNHGLVVRGNSLYIVIKGQTVPVGIDLEYWWRGVLYTTLCNNTCHLFKASLCFSTGTPVSFTNTTDHNDIIETLYYHRNLNSHSSIFSWEIYNSLICSLLFCRHLPFCCAFLHTDSVRIREQITDI